MTEKHNRGEVPNIEDYGSPATDDIDTGKHVGGAAGTHQSSGEGEQFGEWENSNTGTDLTREMDEVGPGDAKTGLIKGGQSGKDEVGGPARYGGDAGSLTGEQQ
jgi:hypothetical protein